MRGRARAGSTQARTLTCMSQPAPAGAPDLCGCRVLSNPDRAPVFLFVFCTSLYQAGASFGPGLARGFLCLFYALPGSLRAFQSDQSKLDGCKVWVWVWFEAFSLLQMEPWLDASHPEQAHLSRPGVYKFGLSLALEA